MRRGAQKPDGVLTDQTLVRQCRAELPYATDAFELLVRRYEPSVLRTCWHLLRDAEEAEEASQDVFIRVFRNLRRFEERSSFRTWLFRIVRNVCATRRTRHAERIDRQAAYRREAMHRQDNGRAEARRDGDLVGRVEGGGGAIGRAAAAAGTLSVADREILVLRFVSDLRLEEIAGMLELSLSATKMRLYRSLERFRRAYENDDR